MKKSQFWSNLYFKYILFLFVFVVVAIPPLVFDMGVFTIVSKWLWARAVIWYFLYRFIGFSCQGFRRVKTKETKKEKYTEIAFAVLAGAMAVLLVYLAIVL